MILVNNIFGHLKTICTHKWWVFYYSCKIGIPVRGFFHDVSKFSLEEFWESARYYQGGKSSPINAAKADKGFSLAWQHHKGRNPHHYEYWTDKYDSGTEAIKVPYKYVMEMIADYYAAGRTYSGKSFTFQGEADWWKTKMETGHPKIHEGTANFILYIMKLIAADGKMFKLNNSRFKRMYDLF